MMECQWAGCHKAATLKCANCGFEACNVEHAAPWCVEDLDLYRAKEDKR